MEVKVKTISVHFLKEGNMVKKQSKAIKKFVDHHDYLNRKVKELTEERKKDRSDDSKMLLNRLKKTKLALKDAISKAKSALTNK